MSVSDADFLIWLGQDNQERVILCEAVVYTGSGTTTRYISNYPFVSRPTDTPANQAYDDIISTIPQFTRSTAAQFTGATSQSWGEIEIENYNGDYDSWLDDGWDGRSLILYLGGKNWAKNDFRKILTGVSEDLYAKDAKTLALKIRDKTFALNVPVQTNVIGGTTANKDLPIPLCYGGVTNIEPVLIDASTHKYQVHDGAINDITNVYDNGATLITNSRTISAVDAGTETITVSTAHNFSLDSRVIFAGSLPSPLVAGTTYWVISSGLTATAFEVSATKGGSAINLTTTTTGGTVIGYNWNVQNSAGTFTLVASPAGQITCDAQGAKPGGTYLTKVADIVNDLVTTKSTLTSADIDSSNFTTMNATAPQAVGIYVKDRDNLIAIIDQLVTSVGGFWGFTRAGLLQMNVLIAPAGTPVVYLTTDDVKERGISVKSRQLPLAQYTLGYAKNYTVQTTGLAGVLTETQLAVLANEFQASTKTNASMLTKHLLADKPDLVPSLITGSSDASTECQRRVDLRNVVRSIYSLDGFAASFQANIGDVIQLTHPRFGFTSGALAVIVGINEDITRNHLQLDIWK